jgi:hypothetical protein
MFEINLEWPAASRHVLRPVEAPRRDFAIYPAKDATIIRRRPLEQNRSLYAEFAKLNGSKESCLQFADKYGLLRVDLTIGGKFEMPVLELETPGALETLFLWRRDIRDVRDIIRRCELSRGNPAEAFRQFGKKDILVGGVNLYLAIKSSKSPANLEVRAGNLIDAINLQAVQSILSGRRSIQCIECSTWFEIGGGARRALSKFCSVRCKDSYHNRLKALALKERQVSPQRSERHIRVSSPSKEK